MPIRVRRPVSVFVRDDTLSIRVEVPAVAVPDALLVITVSRADGSGTLCPPAPAEHPDASPGTAISAARPRHWP